MQRALCSLNTELSNRCMKLPNESERMNEGREERKSHLVRDDDERCEHIFASISIHRKCAIESGNCLLEWHTKCAK